MIEYSNVMYSGGPYTFFLLTTFDAPGILVWANCNLSLSPHFRNLNEGLFGDLSPKKNLRGC